MNAARIFLIRQASRATAPAVGRTMVNSTAAAIRSNSRSTLVACSSYHRTFAAATERQQAEAAEECEKTQENVNMVRDAICRMLEKENELEAKPISNEELEHILAKFAVSLCRIVGELSWR